MAHAEHVPADFVSTFRRRFAPLFGRKIARQRSEQYIGGLLNGRAERRNVTALAGTVDGATARALGWLLNKSPWPTRPIVDELQQYVGETFGAPEGLFTLNVDSFVKRGDNAVGVEKQYVHHLGRTQNCQLGVFLAYGAGQGSALVDAALYLPHSWIDGAARRKKAGVPESVEYQPMSALAVELLRRTREAGHLPGQWVTTWHGEGFEADLRDRLDAEGWWYLLPVSGEAPVYESADAVEPQTIGAWLTAEATAKLAIRRVWEPAGETRRPSWLLTCTDELTGQPVAFVCNAPEDASVKLLERMAAARWETARMLAERCAGVSLDVYRVRGWDGWHRHVALALLASAFRACLPVLPEMKAEPAAPAAPKVAAKARPVAPAPVEAPVAAAPAPVAEPAPVVEPAAELATIVEPVFETAPAFEPSPLDAPAPVPAVAGPTTYQLLVNLADTDWRAVRAFQVWLVADEAGTVLSSSPTRPEIEKQEVGATMEVRFESEQAIPELMASLEEVPEITVTSLSPETAAAPSGEPVVVAADAADEAAADDFDSENLLAALQVELSGRTTAREAGLMPAFEAPTEVIGNAVIEANIVLDEAREFDAARAARAANGYTNGQNGHNGHLNGNGAITLGALSAPVAPPPLPPTESPVRPPAQPSTAPAAAKVEEPAKKKTEEKAHPSEEQMVVLDVGDEAYGVPVQRVREIIRVPPITKVPNGPAFLEGVINLRGQVIPVMDLRKHLGIQSGDETRRSRVVVAELGRHTVGLMVDGVSQVVMVPTADIEPPPSLIAGANDGQVCGVARLGEKLVLFLDPDRMLPNR